MRSRVSIIFFACFAVAFALTGCFSQSEQRKKFTLWMAENGKMKVLSTTVQVGDLVKEIGGERVDSWVLIQGDLDPHSYELVKGDDEKFSRARIVFYSGLGLEHGASLSSTIHAHPRGVNLGEKISEKSPQRILRKNGSIDPHIWMDLSLWKEAADPIADALSAADPEGESFYKIRADALKEKMGKMHQEIFSMLQRVPSQKRYLVTSHDAFHYFTRSYLADPAEGANWTERFAAPEGLAPDGQLNPVDIQAIIDYLREKKLSVLFPESNVSRDSIVKIISAGRELGLEISICSEALYGDSMGSGANSSYFDAMLHNAEVISRYLQE